MAKEQALKLVKTFKPHTQYSLGEGNNPNEHAIRCSLIHVAKMQIRLEKLKETGFKHLNFFDKAIITGELNELESIKQELLNL